MTTLIRSMDEVVAAMRARKDELNLPAEVIDDLAGLPTRYTAKVLAKMKSPGYISLGPMLETLGLALQVVEDPDALKRMRPRYSYRKRPASKAASMPPQIVLTPQNEAKIALHARMKSLAILGGKARAGRLGKRARRRIAKQAAEARWRSSK